eukprot:gene13104-biopygen4999
MAFPSFRNLVARSPRNSIFGGSLARGWCPGQGAGGAWPGPRRQPRYLKGGCIPGSWRPKIEKNDHASSNSDLKSGVIPILLGNFLIFPVQDWHPVLAQGRGRARAQPGLRRGRAWDRALARGLVVPGRGPGVRGGCIPGSWRPKNRKKRPCVFEFRFEIRRHPDTTWLFFSNFQFNTDPPCWPRAAAEPGLSQG